MENKQKCKVGLNQAVFTFLDLSHTSLEGIDAPSWHRSVLFGGHKLNNGEPKYWTIKVEYFTFVEVLNVDHGLKFTEYMDYSAYCFRKVHQKTLPEISSSKFSSWYATALLHVRR